MEHKKVFCVTFAVIFVIALSMIAVLFDHNTEGLKNEINLRNSSFGTCKASANLSDSVKISICQRHNLLVIDIRQFINKKTNDQRNTIITQGMDIIVENFRFHQLIYGKKPMNDNMDSSFHWFFERFKIFRE